MTDKTTDGLFHVMLTIRVRPGSEADFERVWREVADGIACHPANRGQRLLRCLDERSTYVVLTDWTEESSFREFETSEAHVRNRARLRPYREGGSMATLQLVRELPERGAR